MERMCPYCLHPALPGSPCPHCGEDPGTYQPGSHHFPPGKLLHERYLLGRPPRMFAAALSLCFAGMAILYIYRMRRDFPDTPPMLYDPENLLAAFRTILWTHFS